MVTKIKYSILSKKSSFKLLEKSPLPRQKTKWLSLIKKNLKNIPPYLLSHVQQQHLKDGHPGIMFKIERANSYR